MAVNRIGAALDGLEGSLDGVSETVRGMGEAVGAARGQLAHASHFSGELMDGVARVKKYAFRLADTLERPAVRRSIAAGLVLFLIAANVLRAALD